MAGTGTLTKEAVTELEGLVDLYSVADILDALSLICNLKAEHLREAWQDEGTAKTWERDGKKLAALADKVFT